MPITVHTRREDSPSAADLDIDLERVVIDPEYRRHVILFLNAQARRGERARPVAVNAVGEAIGRVSPLPEQASRRLAPRR